MTASNGTATVVSLAVGAIAATFLTAMFTEVSTEFRVIAWLVLFGLIAAMMRGAFRRERRDKIEQALERKLRDRD